MIDIKKEQERDELHRAIVNGKVKCTIFGKVMSEFSASKVQNSRQVKCRTFGNRSKALSTI